MLRSIKMVGTAIAFVAVLAGCNLGNPSPPPPTVSEATAKLERWERHLADTKNDYNAAIEAGDNAKAAELGYQAWLAENMVENAQTNLKLAISREGGGGGGDGGGGGGGGGSF